MLFHSTHRLCLLSLAVLSLPSPVTEAAIFATRPENPVIVDQNSTTLGPTEVLQFPGSEGPIVSIYDSSFQFFYIEDPNTSLLVRSKASPVDYPEFRGYAAALAPGAVIGSSNWLVDEPHVDAWGEARWGMHDNTADEIHPERDYFTRDNPFRGELGLQDLLVFQNPGQQGGRYFAGVGWRRGDDFHYGWIEFLGVSGIQMNVVAWAWESEPNTPILAGAIPEPSAVWLAGAGALLFLRRRWSK